MKLISIAVAAFTTAAPLAAFNGTDDCSIAPLLTGTGTFAFDTTGATTGPHGAPGCVSYIGQDIWFKWTVPSTGTATFSLCGGTTYDSAIAVYNGGACPGTALSIACDDDSCGVQSITSWIVSAGSTYMLQIGSSGGGAGGGSGTFTLDVVGPPANDDCATPLDIGSSGGAQYDNTLASAGTQGQSNPCGSIQGDLWFRWTAPVNGTATLDTCGQTANDTSVAVYGGSGCPTGVALACDDNGCGLQSMTSWPIIGGQVFMLQIGNSFGAGGGPGSFVITLQPDGTAGVPFCFGDGTGASCPCGNNGASGHGCANSVDPTGGLLAATGSASVTSDSLVLSGSGMPASVSALYFQGTTKANGGLGAHFGDGLRCTAGTITRLGLKMNAAGSSSYGGPLGDTPISVRGLIPVTGATRQYQVWYRNAAVFCIASTFNLSNGVETVWIP